MIKLSPDTAVRIAAGEAQALVALLEQASNQLASAAGQALARDLRALASSDPRTRFRIDVARPQSLTDEQAARLTAALGVTDRATLELPDRWTRAESAAASDLRVFSFDQPPLTPSGQLQPTYLVLALPVDWPKHVDAEELEELAANRARVLLLPLDGQPGRELHEVGRRVQRHAWAVDLRDTEQANAPSWRDQLASPEWEPVHAIAQAYAMARACQHAGEAFELLLRRESDALRVRKALVEQRVQQTRGQASAARPQDIAREVESLVKQEYAEFSRGVSEKLGEWTAPQTGELSREVNREIDQLAELHEQPQTHTLVLSVPPDAEKRILDLLQTRLREHTRRNMMALADTQHMLAERIEARLAEANIPRVPLSFGVPALDRFERHLNNKLLFESPYRAEVRKRGPQEFLMAARRFAMPITMLGTPLLLLTSMPGLHNLLVSLHILSAVPDRNAMDPAVKLRIVAALVMVVGGVFIYRRIPIEREEERQRELGKAREALRRDVRRMVADAEREWLQILGEHLRDQPAALRGELEASLDVHLRRQSESVEQDRARIERQLHGLQNTERQIADAERQRGAVMRTFEQLRDRLQQLFGDLQREAARRVPPPPSASRA